MWERTLATPQRPAQHGPRAPALVSTLLLAEEADLRGLRAPGGPQWLGSHRRMPWPPRLTTRARCWRVYDSLRPPTAPPCPTRPAARQNYMMFSCFGGPQTIPELAERPRPPGPARRPGPHGVLPHSPAERAAKDRTGRPDLCHVRRSLNAFRSLDLLGYGEQQTGDPAFARYMRRHTRTLRVEIRDASEARYAEASREIHGGGASRTRSRGLTWTRPSNLSHRKYRPIPHAATGQFFELAVYLHKMQGIMRLAAGAPR